MITGRVFITLSIPISGEDYDQVEAIATEYIDELYDNYVEETGENVITDTELRLDNDGRDRGF